MLGVITEAQGYTSFSLKTVSIPVSEVTRNLTICLLHTPKGQRSFTFSSVTERTVGFVGKTIKHRQVFKQHLEVYKKCTKTIKWRGIRYSELTGSPRDPSSKDLSAMPETRVWSLGQEGSPEKGMATQSSILAWRISWTEEPGGLQSMGSQRVGHDWSDLACTRVFQRQDGRKGQSRTSTLHLLIVWP